MSRTATTTPGPTTTMTEALTGLKSAGRVYLMLRRFLQTPGFDTLTRKEERLRNWKYPEGMAADTAHGVAYRVASKLTPDLMPPIRDSLSNTQAITEVWEDYQRNVKRQQTPAPSATLVRDDVKSELLRITSQLQYVGWSIQESRTLAVYILLECGLIKPSAVTLSIVESIATTLGEFYFRRSRLQQDGPGLAALINRYI